MDKIATAFHDVIAAMQGNLLHASYFVGAMWLITIINTGLGYRLNVLGIWPRTIHGLFGIPFYSFLHGGFEHLFFNSVPLLILADLVMIKGLPHFYVVTTSIIVSAGLAIWLAGRKSIHIGSSCLLMGYFGYLLAEAYFQFNITTIILAGVCLYYFGGLVLALFPSATKNVSWEGHVFGFLAGIGTSYYYSIIASIISVPKFISG
jgi:membrane associated rhomboid family serine protease